MATTARACGYRICILLLIAVAAMPAPVRARDIDKEYERLVEQLQVTRRQFLEKKIDRRKAEADEGHAMRAYADDFEKLTKDQPPVDAARKYMSQIDDLFKQKLIDPRRRAAEKERVFKGLLPALKLMPEADALAAVQKLQNDGLIDKQMVDQAHEALGVQTEAPRRRRP